MNKDNSVLESFRHIGYLDYKVVIKELEKFDTISERLDYLKLLKHKYYDEYEKVIKTFNEDEYLNYFENKSIVWKAIFGNHTLCTMIQIQEPVYDHYFKNGLSNPEFTYWFLKLNAEFAFNWKLNTKDFQSKINSNLKDTFIKAELKQLNDIELKAKNLLLNKEIDIYKHHLNNYKYRREIELLRVLDGNYYKKNTTYTIGCLGSDEVQAYYKHILFKPYLEKLLKMVSNTIDNRSKLNIELQQYYNCIINLKYFKNHLDSTNNLYYRKRIRDWKNMRNENLLNNEVLSKKEGWLKPFNHKLAILMNKLVFNFKAVVEWKEQQTDLHPNTLEVILGKHLQPLKQMVTGFKINLDIDETIAFKMQQYCINGFDLMLIFIKDELLIRIENAPYYNKIQKVITEYKNAIDFESVKLSLDYNAKPNKEKNESQKKESILLTDLFNHINNKKPLHEFESFLIHFKEHKHFLINYKRQYKVYSPGLAYLFSSKDVNAKNRITKEDFKLDVKPYFNTFIEAFENGEKHFENDYEVSKNIFYGNNTSNIVSDIHSAYYHTIYKGNFIGWHGVIHSNPVIITKKILERYGYYSGVLSKADEFILKYPNSFKNFHKCKTETNEPQPPQNELNHFCKSMPLSIPKEHFKALTDNNSKNGKPFLTQDQFNTFIKRSFLGKTDLPKVKFNQAPKGEKLKIQYLFRQFYENYSFEYFDTGQTQDVFIKLLTDNFKGWDFKNVKNNFKTKPKKTI